LIDDWRKARDWKAVNSSIKDMEMTRTFLIILSFIALKHQLRIFKTIMCFPKKD